MVGDRSDAIAAWRRAEARVYPSVMVNAALYQQYVGTVRAVAEELDDVRTEDDLVTAWRDRREDAREGVAPRAPGKRPLMDLRGPRATPLFHPPPADHPQPGHGKPPPPRGG